MRRTILVLAAAAAFAVARPAVADDSDDQNDADARKAVDDALAQKADAPGHTRILPEQANEHAQANAFGKQGELMRAAHSQAGKHGRDDAADARADAANRAAHGAAMSAMGGANADAHAAAGQNRATATREHHTMPGMNTSGSTQGRR